MAKIISQMVARNEADRFLPEVLDHLSKIVDIMVFTDDCSDDKTLEIAESYPNCHAFASAWDEPYWAVNEGEFRNKAWANLEKFAEPGDWILAIDADEKLFSPEPLMDVANKNDVDILGISFYHMWNATHYRVDKAWKPNVSSRMFKFFPNGHFNLRKLACGSEPTYIQDLIHQGRAWWSAPLRMQHLGYTRDEDKQAKYERYMKLDAGDFHARTHIESILDPNPTLVPWE